MKSAVIIANGRFRPSAGLREVVAAADVVICADGGLRHARTLGRAPHIVVGDFDSVPPRLLAWAERRGAELRQHPTAKDKTDTELALDAAVAWGARLVDFLAVMGGRPDHALANLFLLVAARRHGVRSRIHDGRRLLFLVESEEVVPGTRGDTLSFLALSDAAEGITTAGLRYPLAGGRLAVGSSLGISNVIESVPARVTVKRGVLLAMLSRRG
ncbi:MAG TPA: thiamine diphosphokinase [bacterium]|nr:thiamine diphosphokinase [bacterium]